MRNKEERPNPIVSATILNWNDWAISTRSIIRLLGEDCVSEVIVVDNGSVDESRYAFSKISDPKLKLIYTDENLGYSRGKNLALKEVGDSDYTFMLNGDMLYVPGTIEMYYRFFDLVDTEDKPVFAVGFKDWEYEQVMYYTGVPDEKYAQERVNPLGLHITSWLPNVPVNYGLFNTSVLKQTPFVEEGPFSTPGGGYEDDWMYCQIEDMGYMVYHMDRPLLYHNGISSRFLNEQEKHTMRENNYERWVFAESRWGRERLCNYRVQQGIRQNVYPNPFVDKPMDGIYSF